MQAIPMILMAASTAMTMMGQINQGRAAKDTAWANAAIKDREADVAMATKTSQARAAHKEGELASSAALAKGAAGGAGLSESFINYLTEVGSNARYNSESLIYEGKSNRQALKHQGEVMRVSGSNAKRQSQGAAMVTAMKGAASMASLYGGGAGKVAEPGMSTTTPYTDTRGFGVG